MADYKDLWMLLDKGSGSDLLNRIDVAVVVAALAVYDEDSGTDSHAERLVWAKAACQTPRSASLAMLRVLVARHKDNTLQQITGAPDSTLQEKVDEAVNLFI